ncbi:TPA: hypothetical protein DDW35_10080, partial [Candidatus Sumerlaeota bacterium]|nr:hypothetical protein [Candidatus Sumerlaeota bacterium]
MTTRPANVIHVISALVTGGVQRAMLTILPRIDRSRFRIQIYCTYKKGELALLFEEAGIPVHLVPMRSRLNPLDLWRMARRLKEHQADIVHTRMYASNVSGALAARLAGVENVVGYLHSSHELTSAGRIRAMRWTDGLRKGYFAVSRDVKDDFVRSTGIDSSRIIVNYNATNPSPVVADAESAAKLRAELGIAPNAPVIGNVGRLVPVKGLDVFVRAAGVVAKQRPDARFVVVGGGKELQNLKALAKENGVENQVVFAGQRQDMPRFYQMFDLFTLTSRTEGFSNVILEAIHYGLPIVATRVGGVPEAIVNGKTGLLAESESHEQVGQAIVTLLNDKEKAA